MDNEIFTTGFLISIVFVILKCFETKFILKKDFKLKEIFRNALIVYISYIGIIFYI